MTALAVVRAGEDAGFGDGPRLVADIGGTNARFAIESNPGVFTRQSVLLCADYPGIDVAIRDYLSSTGVNAVRHAGIAIANPVDGDVVKMTNHHWQFSIQAIRSELNLGTLLVVNDFTALAMTLPLLGDGQRSKIGGGSARRGRVIGLIGPGTGLGVSGLIPAGNSWLPLASEGGHTTFSPVGDLEVKILDFVRKEHSHVSSERLVSGPGIARIYRSLCYIRGTVPETNDVAEIVQRARNGECPICLAAVQAFSGMLGTFAANVAVTLGCLGGLYIGGGVVGRLGSAFDRTLFRKRFQSKGRFESYLERIPTYEITAELPALRGISLMLDEHINSQEPP